MVLQKIKILLKVHSTFKTVPINAYEVFILSSICSRMYQNWIEIEDKIKKKESITKLWFFKESNYGFNETIPTIMVL